MIISFQETGAQAHIDRVKEFFGDKKHTYFVETYGCQMNVRDSETLAGLLEAMGYTPAASRDEADAVIFNTCCVREGAEDRLRGNLGKLKQRKRENPDLLVMIAGCMMQEEGNAAAIRRRFPFVDVVIGTHNTFELPELMEKALLKREHAFDVWEKEGDVVEGLPVKRESDISAWVNIMYGCNNFCSYCIVPYVRGRERSRKSADILTEVRELADKGIKEITLLGQNVNSYGKNTDDLTFPDLLRLLDRVDGIERIRFMTSHPKDLSDDLIAAMAESRHVCPYLHLPVQSGSDRVLALMNRHYTAEKYLRLTEKLRAAIPEIALSTDIIVGFPTETEEDFRDTLSLYETVCFNAAFTFIYSPRIGTPAAKMEGQIPETVTADRMRRLIDLTETCTMKANALYLNRTWPVLVEGVSRRDDAMLSGRTPSGRMVSFAGSPDLIGQTVNVKINQSKLNTLCGEMEV